MTGCRCVATASLWIKSVSVAPQMPVRRILAFTVTVTAMSSLADLSMKV
jgi:hypothetical protein